VAWLPRGRDLAGYGLRRYANLWLLLALQVPFYWYFASTHLVVVHRPIVTGFALTASVIVLVCLVNLILSKVRWRWLRSALNLLFIVFYGLLIAYRWRRGAGLDFATVASNLGEGFSRSGLRVFAEVGGLAVWGGTGVLILALLVLEHRAHALSTFHRFERPWRAIVILAVGSAIFLGPWLVPNEFFLFAKSIQRYMRHPGEEAMRNVNTTEPFPLFHASTPQRAAAFARDRPPNVFVVLMESFSADFVEQRDAAGREITPYFDSLVPHGAYHKLFFANSMQSERGQTATLCSLIPSYRRKVMKGYIADHFLCVPELLRSAGYVTLWAQGSPDLRFDNAERFMPKAGFQQVIAMDDRFVSHREQKYVWGLGLQDDVFFKKTFAYLDALNKPKDRPIFAVLATISNHMQFDAMPAEDRQMYQDPSSFREQFVNSIHLADGYLKTFFDELERHDYLKNSVVILLGDHGYPTGQHHSTSNEVSFYNELFRVPLLILGANVEPFKNDSIAYSQLDIGPSLLEWLGIATPNALSGVPIPFRAEDLPREQHSIPLVQPYDGGYLASLRYPFKYVYSLANDDNELFDLAADPREAHNLAPSWGTSDPVPELTLDIAHIFLNQRLLDEDRLIPH
jgi:arylsulfatase A-like enzyme